MYLYSMIRFADIFKKKFALACVFVVIIPIASCRTHFKQESKEIGSLPSPKVFPIGINTVLVVCQANATGPRDSLQVRCKHSKKIVYKGTLTSFDEDTPLVTTRLLISARDSDRELVISCFCNAVYTGKVSKITNLKLKPGRGDQNFEHNQQFLPKRKRKRKVFSNRPVRFVWRYHSNNVTSWPRCYHDGISLAKPHFLIARSRIIVQYKRVSVHQTGYYWCEVTGNRTSYSSLTVLRVATERRWSNWFTWIKCDATCGRGRVVQARKCLDKRQRCDGPSVRTMPCFVQCTSRQIYSKFSSTTQTTAFTITTRFTVKASQYNPATDAHARNKSRQSTVFLIVTIVIVSMGIILVFSAYVRYKYKTRRRPCCEIEDRPKVSTLLHTDTNNDNYSRESGSTLESDLISFGDDVVVKVAAIKVRDIPFQLRHLIEILLSTIGPRANWKCLATRIGMPTSYIHIIEQNLELPAKDVFDWWITRNPSAMMQQLMEILKVLERDDILDSILKFYSSDGTQFDTHFIEDTKLEEDHFDVVFDESNKINRKGSSKSKISNFSNFSSVSGAYCPKPVLPDTVNPNLCAWGLFTEKGGILKIKDTGVSLYIPKMALPEGSSQVIYIGLMSRKGLYPKLENGQAVLSPAVICGPDGLQFNKPLYLTVPHNAVSDDENSWKPKVQSCSQVPEDESEITKWKIMEDPNDLEPPLSHIDHDSLQIMIEHFTGYCVIGQPQQMTKWIVSFCTEPKVDLDCRVRIYCIPATKAALEELFDEEKKLSGTVADARKQLNVHNNNKDVVATIVKVKEGWEVDENEQNIPFRDLWQTQNSQNCFPNVTFIFERVSSNQFSFSSSFKINQDMENADAVKVKVASAIKRSQSLSSGYSSSLENGGQTDIVMIIPSDVRRELCYCLDVERHDYRDYRQFAEKLGQTQSYIKWLQRCKYPTNEIIEWWEHSKADKVPIEKLIEIFVSMDRDDAAELLQKIRV